MPALQSTPTVLSSFFEKGYQRLPGMVPASLLRRLHSFFDEMMESAPEEEKVVKEENGEKFVTGLSGLCRQGNLSCLELLGLPSVLDLAHRLCGPDFFLIQEFAVIKTKGDDYHIDWHQDMAHRRKGPCFTMGIYLDPAGPGDGALRVIPGSHLDPRNICEISREPYIEIPMQAGDILIHDMMLAHSSSPLTQNNLRRVIYFEFLSARHVREESLYPDTVIQQRTPLLLAASRYYHLLHPGEPQYPLPHPGFEENTKAHTTLLAEVYLEPVRPRPSVYCLNGTTPVFGVDA